MVNGEPITNFDIEQRSKLNFLTTHKQPTRQEVINELIDEKVKIKEGKKFGVDPSASDIDQSYAAMSSRMRITPDQLTKSLESQGIRADTLKARLKAEMVWTSLVRGRFKESLAGRREGRRRRGPGEGGEKTEAEAFEYQMQPIVLIVPRGSAPAAIEARRKEAEALRERVQSCEEANAYFKSMQNAAIREIVTKTSADIPAVLREVLDKTPIGHLTAPEMTKQGVEMVALCGQQADHRRHAEEEGNPRQDVRREIRGEVEILPAGSPQSRDDRISLMHGKAPRADIRRARGHRARYHASRRGCAAMS